MEHYLKRYISNNMNMNNIYFLLGAKIFTKSLFIKCAIRLTAPIPAKLLLIRYLR